ncbi:MAG: beta-lactamase family protein [Planctomycetes bacterium]|nr:beta-lactamase family protein [Planctomycetota bacterium]
MKKIIRIRYVTILLLICVLAYIFFVNGCAIDPKLQEEYTRDSLSSGIQTVFDGYRQSIPEIMTKHKIPGLSIAVVDHEGILWTAGFGYTDKDKKTPVTPETIFSIQSMSKTFTATAVMFAVQDGLVELDIPITKYLPDFTVNSRYEDDPQDKMTLRHLLTHTAGFTHEAPIGNNVDARSPSYEDHVKSISDTWLKYRVGERNSYSNLGIDLAAYILQVRSGKPINQYMKEKIFDSLDMPNSSVDMEFIKRHPNRAIGHQNHFKELPLVPMLGAGGVYTNANELAKFIQFHINWGNVNDQLLLNANLLYEMYTPSPTNKGYGLGIGIGEKDGVYFLGHGGGGFGFLTTMTWLPEYQIGALVLTNSADHPNKHQKLMKNLILRLVDNKLVQKSKPHENPPWKAVAADNSKSPAYQRPHPDNFTRYQPDWKKYTGTYRYIRGGRKLRAYASIALALGYPDPDSEVKVYEKNGFLEINGERLDEHLPGLFFANEGECLDFRGSVPTWRNFKLKKK